MSPLRGWWSKMPINNVWQHHWFKMNRSKWYASMCNGSPLTIFSDCTCHLTTIPLYPIKPTLWEWIHVKHHAWEMERQIIKDKEMSKEIYLKEAWERTCRQDTKGNQWKETLQKNINEWQQYLFIPFCHFNKKKKKCMRSMVFKDMSPITSQAFEKLFEDQL